MPLCFRLDRFHDDALSLQLVDGDTGFKADLPFVDQATEAQPHGAGADNQANHSMLSSARLQIEIPGSDTEMIPSIVIPAKKRVEANMEPKLVVPESLQPVLENLQRLEPLFHAANPDASPEKFEELVAPQFWEIGASGRRYSRDFALSVLTERQRKPAEDEWKTKDFHILEIAHGNYLLTYTLVQPGRVTRRATLWRRNGGGWQAIYHQGTIVAEQQ